MNEHKPFTDLPPGTDEIIEEIELHTPRDRKIWDRGMEDASHYMQEVFRYSDAAGRPSQKVESTFPSEDRMRTFFIIAYREFGQMNYREPKLYIDAFQNRCLEGYTAKDN